ncbi:MAG: DNA polymerase III subunit gamma/tau [Ignavibacteria bacterium]|jgi:DNA polymerase-3 subunit gamma/tau|nr:DNA polymerase III subunit gamma/tau [Ignavibacteria bacterium]MDH7528329.1 DNA polymerase III subunit gamma/tau [Ignavibacteria bacterium]
MTNFLVTARKWRPQKFEDVVGQEHITQTLKNSIKSGKIAHAFIFSGPRGIGKTSTARILAKSLNCPNQKDYNPCNECEICESITNGSNIDVIEIDGASNRRIDEIRTLRESVQYAPSTAKYKVYIIDEVHMLTTESFNALLKVLEEPPPHIIFIFATTDIHKVPATILSRCQRYEFRRLTTEEIKNHLIKIAKYENIEYDEDALRFIARRADGAMRDAQSLFDQIVVYSNGKVVLSEVKDILNIIDVDLYFRISDAIKNRETEEAFRIVNEIYFNGWDLNTFVNDLIEHFRNMLTVTVTGNTDLIEESEITRERYKNSAKVFSTRDLLRILSFLSKTQYELKQATNQKMKLEVALAQLIDLPKAAEVDELIQEIRKLKKEGFQVSSNSTTVTQTTEKKSPVTVVKEPESPQLNLSSQKTHSDIENKIIHQTTQSTQSLPPFVEKVISKWNDFIQSIGSKNKQLGEALKDSKVVKIEDNILHLYSMSLNSNPSPLNLNRGFLFSHSKDFFGVGFKFFISNEPPKGEIEIAINHTIKNKEEERLPKEEIDLKLKKEDLEIRQSVIDKLKAKSIS